MKKTISILAMTFVTTCSVFSQTKSSIAVVTPTVQGLFITPKMVTKLLNIESTKLNIYNVYDEFDMAETLKSFPEFEKDCYGLKCLTGLGTALKTDYVLTGSFDKLGNKSTVSNKDPRYLSGELTSLSKGRKFTLKKKRKSRLKVAISR